MSKNLIQLSDGSEYDLKNNNDGLLIIFSGNIDNEFIQSSLSRYTKNQNLFEDLGCSLLFVTNRQETTDVENVYYDQELVCNNLSPELSDMTQPCDSIIFLKKDGDNIAHVYTRLKPNPKYDWIGEATGFCRNFYDKNSQNNLWKFGQCVQSSGEYLCTDCGYIIELQEGEVFPVCEVCLSGDPRGACSVKEAFWQEVN